MFDKLKKLNAFASDLGKDPYEGMDDNEKKFAKLSNLLKVLDENVTKKDFEENFKTIVELLKKVLERNQQEFQTLETKYTDIINSFHDHVAKSKKEVFSDAVGEINNRMSVIKNGQDGKDADEQAMMDEMMPKIIEDCQMPILDKLEKSIPSLGMPIRDALELLPEEEKTVIEAIKGLRQELDELRGLKTKVMGGGGGFSKIAMDSKIVDPYTPTGATNGVNTDFVLSNIPNPTVSLKIYKDGQKMKLATDYTLNGRTVTFLSAPLTDTIIEAEHRI